MLWPSTEHGEGPKVWRILPYYFAGVAVVLGVALFAGRNLSQHQRAAGVFGTFWTSGDAVRHGLNPYAVQADTYRVTLDAPRMTIPEENLNPPCVLPLFEAMALLPIKAAAWVYMAFLVSMLIAANATMVVLHPTMERMQAAWILLSAPGMAMVAGGQIYALLLLLSVLMWAALRREGETAAAIFLGAMVAIKPIFLLWVLLIAVWGKVSLAWKSAVTAGLISLIPVLLYGPDVYVQWLHAARDDKHYLYLTNISIAAVGRRFGFATLGVAAAVLLFFACMYAVRTRRMSQRNLHMAGIAFSCLCGPLAWYLYLALLYPWFLERKWDRPERQWAAILLMIPAFVPSAMRRIHGPAILLWIGSAICIAPALLFLVDAVRSEDSVEVQLDDTAASSAAV